MNENEIWKDIEGYEGLYQISSLGQVKSLKDKYGNSREKILKQDKNVYLQITLYKNGKKKTFLVHRLVAITFIDNPNNLPMVNHKDENKENNCVDNLEWCNARYNLTYGTAIQRRVANTDWKALKTKIDFKAIGRKVAEKLTNRQDQSKQVYQYSLDGELIKTWESTAECGRNGFIQVAVCDCCNGKRKTHKGFLWSYKPL